MLKKHQYFLVGLLIGGVGIYVADRVFTRDFDTTVQTVAISEPEPVVEIKQNNHAIKGYPVPEVMTFAGEAVPLDRMDVRERLDRELQVNAFWHSNSIILIKRAQRWLPLLDSILAANDVPTDFKYLAVAESGLAQVVSPAQAVGFWQIMKGTAGDFGLIVNKEVDQRYDPIRSTEAAIKYLKKAYEKFGDWALVAASYNMGMSGVAKVLENQRATSYYDMVMTEEPSRYVFRILALKNMLEDPTAYGFEIDEIYTPEPIENITVEASIANWNDFAEAHGTNYYQLKRLNPWIRTYDMRVKQGQKFEVKIPARE
ncbi:lytic transglycosylase domain-containing protein [Reichenbachiella carrageenanivorans]|uniref:Lytic transglycosylase domain-containing protein n=1 Tax=Reichenbachiella carrageenanivorans TaxID=2979869 RepID=A0ABY6D1Y7_9BACT|nr:lytic transglycosylase domain-containing protein [Reichenbachiella carrageenanivorans]UXX80167.1 lytic transglycosylase domain-containing protein [Reichenbachiella carrageenanivorans]